MDSTLKGNECVPMILTTEDKLSLFEEYLCYKSGYSEFRVNLADALCQPQFSDIFLSASLHFLQRCLEKRLNSLKSESSKCHKSASDSGTSVYSCGEIMACLNGRSSTSICQDPLNKLPTTTQYDEKVKEWSSTFQNSFGKFESCEAFGKTFGNNKQNIISKNSVLSDVRSISGHTDTLQNEAANSEKNSNCSQIHDMNFSNYSLQVKNETIFKSEVSQISCDDLMKLQGLSLICDDKSEHENSQSMNITLSAVETKSINSGRNLPSKISTSIMRLVAAKSKSKHIKTNDEQVPLEEEKSKEILTDSSIDKCALKSFESKQKSSSPILEKAVSKIKHERQTNVESEKKLSTGTIIRLQRVVLRLFKKKNKTIKSNTSTDLTYIKSSNNNNKSKKGLENKNISEGKRTVFSQTSEVLICTNSESQTSNSYISITESGIERLLVENYLTSSQSSGYSEEKKKKCYINSTSCFDIEPKFSKLRNLKIYRMPYMAACSMCKKAFYNKKYKNVATLTDESICPYIYTFTGCPYCSNCLSATKSTDVSYVSQTVSRTFETKVGVGGDEKIKTSFSWESRNSSKTTLYMEEMASQKALQGSALSRILQDIFKEEKCIMAEDSMKMSSRHVDDLHRGIAPGTKRSPKLLRQLSKLSVCADNDLESTISEYETMPRFGTGKKTPIVKPDLYLNPNIHKIESDGGRERCCLQGAVHGIQTPTQVPLNLTIQNLSTTASSLASPPELASDSKFSNKPRSGPNDPHHIEKMFMLPMSLLDFLKSGTPTSGCIYCSASHTCRPKDDKLMPEPTSGIVASFDPK